MFTSLGGKVLSLCGYHVTWTRHLWHVVYLSCYGDLTSSVKHYHPGFTQPKQPLEPVLRADPVPAQKQKWQWEQK